MNNPHEANVAHLNDLIRAWAGGYQFCEISYVAITTSSAHKILFARIALDSTMPDGPKTFLLRSQHIQAGSVFKAVSQSEIERIIQDAASGNIFIDETQLALSRDQAPNFFSSSFSSIQHPSLRGPLRIPNLVMHGVSKYNLLGNQIAWDDIDWELKAAETPYDNLDDLLTSLSLPAISQVESSTLEIVCRPLGWITTNSSLKNNEAMIEFRVATGLDKGKVQVGHKSFKKNKTVRGITFEINWRPEREANIGLSRFRADDVPLLLAFLNYNGATLHQWWLNDPSKSPNPRYLVHRNFDRDLELLRKMLMTPDADKNKNFEDAVSWLFTLLGFSISHHGRIPKLQDGPDILAYTATGHLAIIECTTGILNKDNKISNLIKRTQSTRKIFEDSKISHLQIQPVIVTRLSRQEIGGDLRAVTSHEIAVLCNEDFDTLLTKAGMFPNSDNFFLDLKKYIPALKNEVFDASLIT